MSRVLAAVDDSPAARPVLAVAVEVAKLFDAAPEAVHVRENRGRIAAAAAQAAGVPLREIEAESPVAGLLAAGRARDVAAVVLGVRRLPTGRRPAGHVALELIVGLRKPVVAVPPAAPVPYALERILVPLDASKTTTAALARTIELARRRDLGVIVLHVHDERSLPAFIDQPQHELDAWCREFVARHCPHAAGARVELRVGPPGEHVVEVAAATGTSMIALGWAQDLSPGRAAVVREALARSPVPVLLVPVRRARAGRRSAAASAEPGGASP